MSGSFLPIKPSDIGAQSNMSGSYLSIKPSDLGALGLIQGAAISFLLAATARFTHHYITHIIPNPQSLAAVTILGSLSASLTAY